MAEFSNLDIKKEYETWKAIPKLNGMNLDYETWLEFQFIRLGDKARMEIATLTQQLEEAQAKIDELEKTEAKLNVLRTMFIMDGGMVIGDEPATYATKRYLAVLDEQA